jgi:hypothetical protein
MSHLGGYSNKYDNEDTMTDTDDDDYVMNDIPPPELDPTLCDRIYNIKWNMYNTIVLGPELGTPHVQNNKLVQDYLNQINKVYILSLKGQNGQFTESDLQKFPKKVQNDIKELLLWLVDYFKKNQPCDTIPYSDYITTQLHIYPFNQRKMVGGEYFVESE